MKLAIVCAIAGCYLVVGAYNINILNMNIAGIISGLLAALAFAWWSIHGEYGMRRYNPWTVLFYAMLVASVEWNILHPPLESLLHVYTIQIWFWIIFIAIVGTVLPFGFYYEGINLIRSTRASITSTLEPIMAGIFAFIFLNEVMEPGIHKVEWKNNSFTSGVYYYRLIAEAIDNDIPGKYDEVKKMILLK